jgi:hypothetical protein
MHCLKSPFGRPLLATAALLAALGSAQATVIYTTTLTLDGTEATQLGRISRGGIPQDWSGTETFGNGAALVGPTTPYFYKTLTLDISALEAGYVYGDKLQIIIDSTSANTFLAGYLDSYTPPASATNWLGDPGTSGNYFSGTDPLFFQVTVGAGHSLVLVFNETSGTGLGLNQPAAITIEAYSDTLYTDLVTAVPEAATWAYLLGGLALVPVLRRKLSQAA